MADEYLKLSQALSDNQTAQNRAADAVAALGKRLPCTVEQVVSSGIVTVSIQVQGAPFTFPQLTVPVGWSEYTRLPVQVGCKGYLATADAQLGGVSGLGSGTASLSAPANLGALMFYPVGNTQWQAVINGNTLVLYGEPNVQVQDKTGASTLNISPSAITLASNGHTLVVNGSGIFLDGKEFAPHEHINGGGTGNSGPVA